MSPRAFIAASLALVALVAEAPASPETTFTYQGELTENDMLVTATCDFKFSINNSPDSQNTLYTFNPMTTIRYDLPEATPVRMAVYDVSGRRLRVLVDGRVEAGWHAVTWNGRTDGGIELGSGIYFLRTVSGHETSVQKITLLE